MVLSVLPLATTDGEGTASPDWLELKPRGESTRSICGLLRDRGITPLAAYVREGLQFHPFVR